MTYPIESTMARADSPLETDEKKLVPYFHLDQGYGGIYTLPFYNHDGVDIDHIGTHSCWTCVGVYVRLDDKRCFVAHIDGHTRTVAAELDWIPVNDQQRTQLKTHMAERFSKVLPHPFTNKSEAEKDEIKKSIVILCPRMKMAHPFTGLEIEANGAAIIEAFREHFELSEPFQPKDLAHGFVVNRKTQVVTKLAFDSTTEPTMELLHDLDRVKSKVVSNQTDADRVLLRNAPRMLPPEDKGFFGVPGQSWTMVYDWDSLDWRRKVPLDFQPFMPLPPDHDMQAEVEGEVRSYRDGKVILGRSD